MHGREILATLVAGKWENGFGIVIQLVKCCDQGNQLIRPAKQSANSMVDLMGQTTVTFSIPNKQCLVHIVLIFVPA